MSRSDGSRIVAHVCLVDVKVAARNALLRGHTKDSATILRLLAFGWSGVSAWCRHSEHHMFFALRLSRNENGSAAKPVVYSTSAYLR